jgi:hypothetical protein
MTYRNRVYDECARYEGAWCRLPEDISVKLAISAYAEMPHPDEITVAGTDGPIPPLPQNYS